MGLFRKPAPAETTPLAGVELLLADLDGVVYRGRDALPYAVDSITRAQESTRVAYITNNAARTAEAVAEQLTGFGLLVTPDEVVTSPQAAVTLLAELVPAGSLILVVGGEGLTAELDRAGFRVTRNADDEPAAVIQGFHPSVGWAELAEASFALQRPGPAGLIPWVATNSDWSIPVERGIAPGNGTLVSAVHSAVGRLPIFAGKPERAIFDTALTRFGGGSALVIGDRLDTDILGANRAEIPAALVLTGIDGARQLFAAPVDQRPSFVLGDLRGLHESYPVPQHSPTGAGSEIRSGDAAVMLSGNRLGVTASGPELDLVRAAAAAIWASPTPIYGLVLDDELMGLAG